MRKKNLYFPRGILVTFWCEASLMNWAEIYYICSNNKKKKNCPLPDKHQLYHLCQINCWRQNPDACSQSIRKFNVCSFTKLHWVSLIIKVCFPTAMVANATPELNEATSGNKCCIFIYLFISFTEVWRRFIMIFPSPKVNENRPRWLIGTTVVCSCFIYEGWWFSPACLPGPVIHEWTRRLSMQLWWCTGSSGYWGLISFVSDCYSQPPSNPSLFRAPSTPAFSFLSLIVSSTIICQLPDKWSKYYSRICLWYTVVSIMYSVWEMI